MLVLERVTVVMVLVPLNHDTNNTQIDTSNIGKRSVAPDKTLSFDEVSTIALYAHA